MSRFRHWEEAAQQSKWKRAVSNPQVLQERGRTMRCEIVIGDSVEPYWCVQGSPGIKVRKATSSEVDGMHNWGPY